MITEDINPKAATNFCEWWHSNDYGNYGIHHAQLAWSAAQQAERERIKKIITYQFGDLVSDLSEVMEMIDE